MAKPSRTAQLAEENFSASFVLAATTAKTMPRMTSTRLMTNGQVPAAGLSGLPMPSLTEMHEGEHPECDHHDRGGQIVDRPGRGWLLGLPLGGEFLG